MSARMCCKHLRGTYHKGCLKGFCKCARPVVTDIVVPQIKIGDRSVRLVMFPVLTVQPRRPSFSTTASGPLLRTMSCYAASCEAGSASNLILRFCCHAHAIPCHRTNARGILKWAGTPRLQIVRHVVLQHGWKFSRPSHRKGTLAVLASHDPSSLAESFSGSCEMRRDVRLHPCNLAGCTGADHGRTVMYAPKFYPKQRRCQAPFVARRGRRAVGTGDAFVVPSPLLLCPPPLPSLSGCPC